MRIHLGRALAIALALSAAVPAAVLADNPLGRGMAQLQARGLSGQDTNFLVRAAQSGEAEVKSAAVALQRSKTPAVDSVARRMLTEHTAANKRLTALIGSKGMQPPSDVGPDNTALMAKLQPLHGAAFDSAYLAGQKTAHQQAVALFQREVASGTDRSVVAFARQTLPALQQHLTMITEAASHAMSAGTM